MAAAAAGAAAATVAALSLRDAALFRTDSGEKLVRITGCWAPTKIWAICPPISLQSFVVSGLSENTQVYTAGVSLGYRISATVNKAMPALRLGRDLPS